MAERWLSGRVLTTARAEDSGSVSSTSMATQVSIATVPGDLVPTFDLCGYLYTHSTYKLT